MKYPYYPGCTLYSKARNLDRCGRLAAARAGFELEELPSWNCCGAIYNTSADDLAAQVDRSGCWQRQVSRAEGW